MSFGLYICSLEGVTYFKFNICLRVVEFIVIINVDLSLNVFIEVEFKYRFYFRKNVIGLRRYLYFEDENFLLLIRYFYLNK